MTSGAIESAQLRSAQAVKKPSERKITQTAKPIRSGSTLGVMCVEATHCMELNHPQQVRAKKASQAACRAIIATGRKDNVESIRFRMKLRPRPETTTQASPATGRSHRKITMR